MMQDIEPQDHVIVPAPSVDWLNQRELAELFGFSERTASIWAREGRFKAYEHGCPVAGRRKYSSACCLSTWHAASRPPWNRRNLMSQVERPRKALD